MYYFYKEDGSLFGKVKRGRFPQTGMILGKFWAFRHPMVKGMRHRLDIFVRFLKYPEMKDLRTVIGKYLPLCVLLLIATLGFNFTGSVAAPANNYVGLYDSLELGALDLSRDAFEKAIQGFLALETTGQLRNADVLSIIDFSLPSSKKRLFVIDMRNGRLLFNTFVAHGRNSGALMATRFSNRRNSYMSSLGFYLTGQSFIGRHGYSLRLEGMEKGWNDLAYQRAIIMHPARYVSEQYIRHCGLLGRSEGCPAIPEKLHTAIIDQIKGGSCLFLYAPDKSYLDRADPFS
jgi:hypothetical protein